MKLLILISLILFKGTYACTNYIVTKGACTEGVNMFSYTADSFPMYGDLYHWDAGYHDADEVVHIYDWNEDFYHGDIPQATYTYNVVGNMNEYSLAIGETTFVGREELMDENAIVDYGSLIYITLQRCRTAREAISFIVDICNKYGFASEGESFTIGDPDEIWIMEMVAKTNPDSNETYKFEWTATLIPDGHISGHANQCRTRYLNTTDTNNTLYSPDLYEWAVKQGYTDAASIEEMDVTEVFNPIEASGARTCDGRVFAFFHSVVTEEQSLAWEDYVYGKDLTERLPFTIDLTDNSTGILNKTKVSLDELQAVIGNHYEGTSFAPEYDMSGLYFHMQQRPRPLTWSVDLEDPETNVTTTYNFTHERPAGCQQTAWHFVAVCKREMADGTTIGLDWEPEELQEGEKAANKQPNLVFTGGIFWFGCDDATCSVQIPLFPCLTNVPVELTRDKANIFLMNRNSIFWINNLVANWAYTNWRRMKPVVQERMAEERQYFHAAAEQASVVLADLAHADPKIAVEYANQAARSFAKKLCTDWNNLFEELFRTYFDGMGHIILTETTNKAKQYYSEQAFYDAIVDSTGDRYLLPTDNAENHARALRRMARTFAK